MKRLKEYSGLILLLCVFTFLIYHFNSKTFDISKFNVKNEKQTITELTSEKYEGRLAGTEGSKLALEYVENYFKKLGVEPGGDNGTYYQNLKSMVPMHMSEPYFKIIDRSGKLLRSYVIGKEYNEMLNGYGGSGMVDAELVYLNKWIRLYKPAELAGKVIVVNTLLGDNEIKYALQIGVKGILSPVEKRIGKTAVSTENKMGESLMINLVRPELYPELVEYAKKKCKVSMKLDEEFQYIDTPNLLGKIEGAKKNAGYLIISAHLDGFGKEFDGKTYYPGAVESAAGTSIVMELARVFAMQKNKLDKTVVFAIWNNETYGKRGKQFYVNNPIYPLTKSSIIYIGNIGSENSYDYQIDYNGQASQIMKDKMAQFASRVAFKTDPESVEEFTKRGAIAVRFGDNIFSVNDWGTVREYPGIGTEFDTVQHINEYKLVESTRLLLQFVKKEIAGDVLGGLFRTGEKLLVGGVILAWLLVFLVNTMNRLRPELRIVKPTIEDIYYSTPYEIFDKMVRYLSQAGLVAVVLVFLTRIPNNLNLFVINGVIHTNFSWNQVIADTVNYFRSLFNIGFGVTYTGVDIWEYITFSFGRSFWLLFAALVVGMVFGIAKGIFDAFKDDKKSDLRTVGTIMVFSLPDVFVVIMIQMLLIFVYSNDIINIPRQYMDQKLFIEALLCLVVLPSIYITRIASVAVHEEKKKGYVKAAKAKGLSDFEIITNHLLISVLIKVTEALPSLLSLMISNLIIVEYLSAYRGIATNMMVALSQGEVNTYTGLAIALCVLYVAYVVIFKLSGKLLNPLKRREI